MSDEKPYVGWFPRCSPKSQMCRAARGILEELTDSAYPLNATQAVEGARRRNPQLNGENVRRRLHELLAMGAIQRAGRKKLVLTAIGDRVLEHIYGEDPDVPAFPSRLHEVLTPQV